MSKDNLATIPNDLVPIPECARLIGRSYTSVYSQIRKGNVTVHFIAGDSQAKVSLYEAQELFKTVPRKFSAPTFRIVRNRYGCPTSLCGVRLSENSHFDLLMRGALISCIRPGMMPNSYQRVEVITGLRRRRDWSDAEKARILAESADPEVNISEVARRNGVSRGLLNVWRRKARHASSEGPQFVQVRLDDGFEARPDAVDRTRVLTGPAERIEIVIVGATVRVPAGVDERTLESVLAALRSRR